MRSETVRSGITLFVLGVLIGGFGYADMEYYLTEIPIEFDEIMYYTGGVMVFIGFIVLVYGLLATKPTPTPPRPPTAYYQAPAPTYAPTPAPQPQAQPPPPPLTSETGGATVIREKEIIREIIMIPCKYCGSLMPQTATSCPNCGANRAT